MDTNLAITIGLAVFGVICFTAGMTISAFKFDQRIIRNNWRETINIYVEQWYGEKDYLELEPVEPEEKIKNSDK